MKIYRIFTLAVFVAAAIIGLVSCDGTEDVDYSPAPATTGQRVYFSSLSYSFEVPDDATEVTVDLYRPAAVAKDAFTVQLLTTDPSGLFTVPTQASFAAGDTMTVLPVKFEAAKLESAKSYRVTISVDEAQANEYGISTATLTITRLSWTEWTEIGTGVYTFTQWYEGMAPAKVMERHLTTDELTAQYQFLVNFDETDPESYELWLEAATTDGGETVTVPEQVVGYHPSYGDVYLADVYTYTGDPSYAPYSFFNPENGLFTLYLICYCDAGVFGDGNEYCQLDGYADTKDYKLTLTDCGNVTIDNKDFVIIRFEMNENVAEVKYSVHQGTLTDEEIADLVAKISAGDESVPVTTVRNSGNLAMAPPETGQHTMVAVGFNEAGEAKASASLVFDYGADAAPAKLAPRRLAR